VGKSYGKSYGDSALNFAVPMGFAGHLPSSVAEAQRSALGAQGRDRTTDTAIFSRMLYQLSYLGVSNGPKACRAGGL
jgi:hypothetical protein